MINIVFGTLKGTKQPSVAKYPGKAVITIEGAKEAGRSRRVLFNDKACELLELENKEVQTIMFGFLADDGNENKSVLLSNISGLPENPTDVVYKTSRNKVSFEDSKEKGKAISSSNLIKDIDTFIGLGDEPKEFEVSSFDTGVGEHDLEYELFQLKEIGSVSEEIKETEVVAEEVYAEGQIPETIEPPVWLGDTEGDDVATLSEEEEEVIFE
jgi:hypothetical protein